MSLEANQCLNCGSNQHTPLFTARDFDTALNRFTVATCLDCGLSYTGGVTDDALDTAYSHTYYGSEKAKFVSVIEAMVRVGQQRHAKKILDVYGNGQSVAGADIPVVLDIGCGRGLLLQAFSAMGSRCLGIERSSFTGTESADIEIHVGALGDEVLAERCFDIIVIWHVLEHVTDLGALLDELPRHLNAGGLLVVSVPNFSSWQSRLFRQHWFHLDIPRHVIHFEKPWLEHKLQDMGFVIERSNTFTATQNVYGFIQSSLNKFFPKRPNRLYHLLTRGRGAAERVSLIGWGLLGGLLMPLALLETVLSELFGRGATLTLYARKEKT